MASLRRANWCTVKQTPQRYDLHSVILVLLFLVNGYSLAADGCPRQIAPDKFPLKGYAQRNDPRPGNIGIVPHGFVDLGDGSPVVHGIDVSKWQSAVDFVRIAECGGRFAYVRLSAGISKDSELEYRSHWANARSVKLMVGPYHNLSLTVGPVANASESDRARLLKVNEQRAKLQAHLFISRLKEVLALDPIAERTNQYLGLPYLPIVLDASLRPNLNLGPEEVARFGPIYRAAICAWFSEVSQERIFSRQQLMLFTFPYIYDDYGFSAASCGLKTIPVWISHRNRDGDRYDREPDPALRAAIANLCVPDGKQNRCRFHQYTSYGGFALFQAGEGLDLNRFYGSEEQLRGLLQRAAKE